MATRVYSQDENRKREITVKKIKFGILGAGFGERVIYPCINFTRANTSPIV